MVKARIYTALFNVINSISQTDDIQDVNARKVAEKWSFSAGGGVRQLRTPSYGPVFHSRLNEAKS